MKKRLLVAFIFSLPTLAQAHLLGGGNGFVSGLGHPILGFDHLLAMLCVGILSARTGGRAIWTVPLTFLGMMVLGGVLAMAGLPLFSVETGIAFSVLALGLALAVRNSPSPLIAMLLAGFFAIFHGHAHGSEMPVIVHPALYTAGFVTGTAGIHLMGVAIGLGALQSKKSTRYLRYAGIGIAAIGLQLVLV